MSTNNIAVNKCFSANTIAASGSLTTIIFDLNNFKPNGFYSLQVTVTRSGACKFEYLCSNDGENFVEPVGASDISSGVTAVSSAIISFSPVPCAYLRIKCTETGGANSVTVSAWLCIV